MDDTETAVTADQFGVKLDPSIQRLLEAYGVDEKNNFFVAYMYLKHHFNMVYRLSELAGLATTATPPEGAGRDARGVHAGVPGVVGWTDSSARRPPSLTRARWSRSDAKQLVTIKEPIDLRNTSNVIPFEQANSIILENPTPPRSGDAHAG